MGGIAALKPSPAQWAVERSDVLRLLDDTPETLESRAMLLEADTGRIFGDDPRHCVILQPRARLASMVGNPERGTIRQALEASEGALTLLAQASQLEEARAAARGWREYGAVRLARGHAPAPRRPAWLQVRLVEAAAVAWCPAFPEDVLDAVRSLPAAAEVALCWSGASPVSLCCAAWETERWWDVFVHTLEPYRSMGCAAAAADLLARRFLERGKAAAWFAYADNPASIRLARRLGFFAVERLTAFCADESRAEHRCGRRFRLSSDDDRCIGKGTEWQTNHDPMSDTTSRRR